MINNEKLWFLNLFNLNKNTFDGRFFFAQDSYNIYI
jgi:hypothetical protein